MPVYQTTERIAEKTGDYKAYYAEKVSWASREGVVRKKLTSLVAKNAALLDIGAGGGAFLKSLLDDGYTNLYGADLENYLSDVKPETLRGFSKTNINSERLVFKDASFDVVTGLAFLEHVENAFHFSRECARVLKSGGYLFVTLPHIYNLRSRIRFLFGGNLDGYTVHNDHIMVLPREVFEKCFFKDFTLVEEIPGNSFFKLPFTSFKVRFLPPRWFGNKILFILKKK